MKILICPDKFKESLTAEEAALHIRNGIMKAVPEAECKVMPMADGGEGTVAALVRATDGRKVNVTVHDPLMRRINSFIGISGDGNTGFIEMSAASGMALIKASERNPLKTTSFGTGELIRFALEQQCRNIIIGLGGSATVDGGVGMAQALGARFTGADGKETGHGGDAVGMIENIDLSGMHSGLKHCTIQAAADVNNVFTGKKGAAYVFAPQKGASPGDVTRLDDHLTHLAVLIRNRLKINVGNIPGGGAAGGMGAGIVAFLGGEIKNGFELIASIAGLDGFIADADLVVTGEGKMDAQTGYGKTPAGVAAKAKEAGKPVIAFVGAMGADSGKLYELGFTSVIPIADKPMTLEESILHAGTLLENASERIFMLIRGLTRLIYRI